MNAALREELLSYIISGIRTAASDAERRHAGRASVRHRAQSALWAAIEPPPPPHDVAPLLAPYERAPGRRPSADASAVVAGRCHAAGDRGRRG